MVHGEACELLVHGEACELLVHGEGCEPLVHGEVSVAWYMVHGIWCMVYGACIEDALCHTVQVHYSIQYWRYT